MTPTTLLVLASPTARHLAGLERIPDDVHIVTGNTEEAFETAADSADAVFCDLGTGALLSRLWPRLARLRWVHAISAGVEGFLFPELIASPVPLTNARGVFAGSLAEFVLAAALFFAKDLRRMVRSQEAGLWDQFDVSALDRHVLGVVGYGAIGREAARLASAFGMRVLAVRRRAGEGSQEPGIERVFTPRQLREMLPLCDYVVMAAPLTPDTRAMIGPGELRAMKPSAVIINVGRGPVIDEAALISALREKSIRGAALDVFDEEPLPDGHPFYSLGNVLLSPHCADHTPGWLAKAVDFFVDNFLRFHRGEPVENVVDKLAGY